MYGHRTQTLRVELSFYYRSRILGRKQVQHVSGGLDAKCGRLRFEPATDPANVTEPLLSQLVNGAFTDAFNPILQTLPDRINPSLCRQANPLVDPPCPAGTHDVAGLSLRFEPSDPVLGRLAQGGIEARTLPGDHYGLLRRPQVEVLAGELLARLGRQEPPEDQLRRYSEEGSALAAL